jgi:hypothetical protein
LEKKFVNHNDHYVIAFSSYEERSRIVEASLKDGLNLKILKELDCTIGIKSVIIDFISNHVTIDEVIKVIEKKIGQVLHYEEKKTHYGKALKVKINVKCANSKFYNTWSIGCNKDRFTFSREDLSYNDRQYRNKFQKRVKGLPSNIETNELKNSVKKLHGKSWYILDKEHENNAMLIIKFANQKDATLAIKQLFIFNETRYSWMNSNFYNQNTSYRSNSRNFNTNFIQKDSGYNKVSYTPSSRYNFNQNKSYHNTSYERRYFNPQESYNRNFQYNNKGQGFRSNNRNHDNRNNQFYFNRQENYNNSNYYNKERQAYRTGANNTPLGEPRMGNRNNQQPFWTEFNNRQCRNGYREYKRSKPSNEHHNYTQQHDNSTKGYSYQQSQYQSCHDNGGW